MNHKHETIERSDILQDNQFRICKNDSKDIDSFSLDQLLCYKQDRSWNEYAYKSDLNLPRCMPKRFATRND